MHAYLKLAVMLSVSALLGCAGPVTISPLEAPKAQLKPAPARAAPASPATVLAVRCTDSRCDFDLTRNYASAWRHEVLVDACLRNRYACSILSGRLTNEGRRVFAALRDTLVTSELAELYGYPGETDGPTYGVVLPSVTGSAPSHHRYDPVRLSGVPEPLRQAHAVFEEVRQAVMHCVSSALVTIVGPCEVFNP